MASVKKTYFLVPKWDIPPEAISLGDLIVEPTEPHRHLNSNRPLQPGEEAATGPPQIRIDTPIYERTFTPYNKTASASKKKSLSLISQLSLLTGFGGNISFSSTESEDLSYRARTMHSEWFIPSRDFVLAAIAQPEVDKKLAMLSSRHPIYMITGVRHVTGFMALSHSEK